MAEPLQVDVVAADGRVWQGPAITVIVRTTEGDIGILSGHEPLLAALVPHAAEIVTEDGRREIFAVDGGFVSVNKNNVSVLAQYASRAEEVSAQDARRELDELNRQIEEGDIDAEGMRRHHFAKAQIHALEKHSGN